MTAFVMLHAGGLRRLPGYSVPEVRRQVSVTLVPNAGGGTSVFGDRLVVPDVFPVSVSVAGGTLEASYRLAYGIVREAEAATLVRTHWGDVLVDGIRGYSMQPSALSVWLTLEFLPTSGSVADLETLSWDSTSLSFDSAIVTFDQVFAQPGSG